MTVDDQDELYRVEPSSFGGCSHCVEGFIPTPKGLTAPSQGGQRYHTFLPVTGASIAIQNQYGDRQLTLSPFSSKVPSAEDVSRQ
jgi:hypothetical protein